MAAEPPKRVVVVAGLGDGSGTGASTARLLGTKGYSVALISRGADVCKNIAGQITDAGGEAATFPVSAYTHDEITAAWSAIHERYPSPTYIIRVCVFNVSHRCRKPFLEITQDDIANCLQNSVKAAFSFARGAILALKDNNLEEPTGKRGTLIFTGATASVRGNTTTSAFSASKFGLRALSQSLAKEFGKENIHVAHCVVDGGIVVDWLADIRTAEWAANENGRLKPESIAASYLYLVNQDRSAWTWELDRESSLRFVLRTSTGKLLGEESEMRRLETPMKLVDGATYFPPNTLSRVDGPLKNF